VSSARPSATGPPTTPLLPGGHAQGGQASLRVAAVNLLHVGSCQSVMLLAARNLGWMPAYLAYTVSSMTP
jgi:hypothetical protein